MNRLPFLLLAAALASCGRQSGTTHTESTTTSVQHAARPLAEGDLYDKQAVFAFLRNSPQASQEANDLFRQGVKVVQEKKEAGQAEAAGLFRKSLLIHPTAKAYYELGRIAFAGSQYEKALQAYRMSEALGYDPVGNLYIQMAQAYAGLEQEGKAVAYVEYAIEAGYTNADKLLSSPELAAVRRNGYLFQAAYQEAMGGASDPETVRWQTFQRGFADLRLPLVLNAETERMLNKEEYISYEFEKFIPEMRGERFSRDVGKEFFYLARISRTPQYTALVYAVRNVVMGDNAPYSYVIACFDPKGKLIDRMTAGGREDEAKPLRVATIKANLGIEVQEYHEEFEKDPEKEGYYDNKVISTELQRTRNYRIAADGHFSEEGAALGMR